MAIPSSTISGIKNYFMVCMHVHKCMRGYVMYLYGCDDAINPSMFKTNITKKEIWLMHHITENVTASSRAPFDSVLDMDFKQQDLSISQCKLSRWVVQSVSRVQ